MNVLDNYYHFEQFFQYQEYTALHFECIFGHNAHINITKKELLLIKHIIPRSSLLPLLPCIICCLHMTDDLVSKIVSIYFQRCRRRPSLSLTHSASAQTPPSPILMRLFPDTSLHFSPKLNGSAAAVNYVSEGGEVGGWEVETTSRGAGRLATIVAKNCLNL